MTLGLAVICSLPPVGGWVIYPLTSRSRLLWFRCHSCPHIQHLLPSCGMGDLSRCCFCSFRALASGFGFEPKNACALPVFRTGVINHSTNPTSVLMDLDTAPDLEEVFDGGGRIWVFSHTFHGAHDIFTILLDLCHNGINVILNRK